MTEVLYGQLGLNDSLRSLRKGGRNTYTVINLRNGSRGRDSKRQKVGGSTTSG